MSKTKILSWGIVTGLLGALLLLSSCVPAGTGGTQGGGGDYTLIIFLVLLFGVFYFLMIRPQRKRQKDHQNLMQQLKKGDRVITAGGMYGQIDSVNEDTILLKIESGGTIRIARNSIIGKLDT